MTETEGPDLIPKSSRKNGPQERQQEMRDKNNQQHARLSSSMVEDKATEKLKKRAQDLGLIVNAGAGKATKPTGKKKGGRK